MGRESGTRAGAPSPMSGDRASGRNCILPILQLQDQDMSAEGAPIYSHEGKYLLVCLTHVLSSDPTALISDNPMPHKHGCYYCGVLLAYGAVCQTNNIASLPENCIGLNARGGGPDQAQSSLRVLKLEVFSE